LNILNAESFIEIVAAATGHTIDLRKSIGDL